MSPATLLFDSVTDQLVVRIPGADGEGDVELLRMDAKQLSADDKRRLRAVRDPKQTQPAPDATPVTRR